MILHTDTDTEMVMMIGMIKWPGEGRYERHVFMRSISRRGANRGIDDRSLSEYVLFQHSVFTIITIKDHSSSIAQILHTCHVTRDSFATRLHSMSVL